MPIQFQREEIGAYFGVSLCDSRTSDTDSERYWIEYSGRLLRYSLIIDVRNDTVMISGDPEFPWGGNSMFEIGVPCTSIRLRSHEPDGTVSFDCSYVDSSGRSSHTLTILKRADGDLTVWPSPPLPDGHPNAPQRESW